MIYIYIWVFYSLVNVVNPIMNTPSPIEVLLWDIPLAMGWSMTSQSWVVTGMVYFLGFATFIMMCLLRCLWPGLVNVYITMERSTILLMGKLTISMVIFNSYVSHYQRVSCFFLSRFELLRREAWIDRRDERQIQTISISTRFAKKKTDGSTVQHPKFSAGVWASIL